MTTKINVKSCNLCVVHPSQWMRKFDVTGRLENSIKATAKWVKRRSLIISLKGKNISSFENGKHTQPYIKILRNRQLMYYVYHLFNDNRYNGREDR